MVQSDIYKHVFWDSYKISGNPEREEFTYSVLYSQDKKVRRHPAMRSAVIICSPLGQENSHSHRYISLLAEKVAQKKGYCSLKFDWFASGDSSGHILRKDFLILYKQQLQSLSRWLYENLGVSQIVLVAYRSAALVVAAVLEDLKPELPILKKIVFWHAISNGKSFVRGCEILSSAKSKVMVGGESLFDVGGSLLDQEAKQCFSDLQLFKTDFSSVECVAFVQPVEDVLSHELKRLLSCKIRKYYLYQYRDVGGMLSPALLSKPSISVYEQLLYSVVGDLSEQDVLIAESVKFGENKGRNESVSSKSYEEIAVRLPATGVFAIICKPHISPFSKVWLIPNGGAAPHTGPARLHVKLARALSERGITTVRMDFRGLGEGLEENANPNCSLHPFPKQSGTDILGCLDFLESEYGVSRVVVGGLCSAGHNAFHYYLNSADKRIEEIVFINPIDFYWREGMPVVPHLHCREIVPESLYSFFSRVPKVRHKLRSTIFRILCKIRRVGVSWFVKNPINRRLRRDFDTLCQAGINTSLFVSKNEPGLRTFRRNVGSARLPAIERGLLKEYVLPASDHAFVWHEEQNHLLMAIQRHFSK